MTSSMICPMRAKGPSYSNAVLSLYLKVLFQEWGRKGAKWRGEGGGGKMGPQGRDADGRRLDQMP